MPNRSPVRALVLLLLVLAGAAAIGVLAYNAGVQHGFVEASRTAAVPPESMPRPSLRAVRIDQPIALDGRLFSLNKATGEMIWERKVADPAIAETITVRMTVSTAITAEFPINCQ